MKKKILAILLTLSFVFAMLTGCGGASDDGKKESGDAASEVQETEEETTEEETSAETEEAEEPKEVLTGDTEITDEDLQELYDTIAETLKEEYLEPNGIAPEDFVWPAEDNAEAWSRFYEAHLYATMDIHSKGCVEKVFEFDSDVDAPAEVQITKIAFQGIINWLNNTGTYDADFLDKLIDTISLPATTFPENITFTE